MKVVSFLSFLLLSATSLLASSGKLFNVTDFGAVADGNTLCSDAIQRAINACSDSGGGVVLVEGGDFLSGTILLKDGVTLKVSEGSRLLGSKNPNDYETIDPFVDATGQVRGKCLLGAVDATNIGLCGKGTIDGQGKAFQHDALLNKMEELGLDGKDIKSFAANRPFLVRFVRSKNIAVRDIELRQPAAWTCHFFQCDGIEVDGLRIFSHAHRNNDGIDLDSSSNVVIKNCDINSGDDAVCFKTTSPVATENVYVSNCRLKSDWGTIKFGTESMGDFRNITVENCQIWDTKGGGIKILSMDGANLDNIVVRNITMTDVDMPLFVRLGERLRTYRDAEKLPVGSMKNVVVENITAVARDLEHSRVAPPAGVLITGTPDHRIESLTMENIKITLPGGGDLQDLEREVAEDVDRYPEFSFFGVLPAYGLMARHVEQLNLENVSFVLTGEDHRNRFHIEDVQFLSTK